MMTIEHQGTMDTRLPEVRTSEGQIVSLEDDTMVRSFFTKAANAVINASDLRREMQELRSEVQGLRETINSLVRERDEAIRERNQARAEAAQAREDLERVNEQRLEAQRRNERINETLTKVYEERDQFYRSHLDERERAAKAETAHGQLQGLHADVVAKFGKLQTEHDDRQLALWTEQEHTKALLTEVDGLKTEVSTLRDGHASRDERIATLVADLAEWKAGANLAREEVERLTMKLADIQAVFTR